MGKDKKMKKGGQPEIEDDATDYKDLYLHALADYRNLARETEKDKLEFAKYSNRSLIEELIPVYEHLKTALDHASGQDSSGNLRIGLEIVLKEFMEILKRNGVEEIDPSGKDFDYNTMDAVETQECASGEKDGAVARVIKSGYALHGKVIRPAVVAVYKGKTDAGHDRD